MRECGVVMVYFMCALLMAANAELPANSYCALHLPLEKKAWLGIQSVHPADHSHFQHLPHTPKISIDEAAEVPGTGASLLVGAFLVKRYNCNHLRSLTCDVPRSHLLSKGAVALLFFFFRPDQRLWANQQATRETQRFRNLGNTGIWSV